MDPASLLIANYARRDVTMTRGRGVRLWDATGRDYLDLFAGFGGCVLGHCHPDLVDALHHQANTLWHVGNTFHSDPQLRLAAHLADKAYDGRAFFCHGGMDANEAAVKLARRRGSPHGRYKVVTFNASFHGRSLAMIAAGSTAAHREGFGPAVPGFVHATGGDIDDLARHVDNETCAVMFEPLRGEGGMIGYPTHFPRQVRDFCDERGLTLIFDEVWTGGGRTGRWFGHQHFGDVVPDLMTLGKAVGGGLPTGILWANPEHAQHLPAGTHGSTLGGNPLCAAVAATVFDVIERDGLLAHATRMGDLAEAFLREALPDAQVRGHGLFLGVDLKREPSRDLIADTLDAGLVVNVTQKTVVRLAPALVITEAEWLDGLQRVVRCVKQAM